MQLSFEKVQAATSLDNDTAHQSPSFNLPSSELKSAAQPDLTRDTCRELGLTPGEVRAAYYELNRQITAKRDIYVDGAAKATTDFKAFLSLLDEMHSMLSQRGSKRNLLDTLRLPTWSDWFEDFRSRLHEDINIRTIQRWLKQYRSRDDQTPLPKDVNVRAKESIRHLESKTQAEKLDAEVEDREQLNPTIHADLIRALKADVKNKLALVAKLEKGFKPLKTRTGKALQRLVRERRAQLPDPLLEEKKKLAANFKNATVKKISYDTAKNVILANEYLGTMPGAVTNSFGLYFGRHLGSVVCFGSVGGTKVAESVCGPENKDKVAVLVRGATESWADPVRKSGDGKTHAQQHCDKKDTLEECW